MDGNRLVLGTWQLDESDWEPLPTGAAKKLIREALRRGISEFDTAESYGNGRAEQILGQVLKGNKTPRIATKTVLRQPDQISTHLRRSLRRLNRSSIDLFYIHWPREGLSLADALDRLEEHRSEGIIARIGASNLTEEHRAVFPRLDAIQLGYNLIWRHPERALLRLVRDAGVLLYAYSPLAQGLLAHRFPENGTISGHRAKTPLFSGTTGEAVLSFHHHYHSLCEHAGVHPAALAIEWLLDRGVDRVVFGTRSPEQLAILDTGLAALRNHRNRKSLIDSATALSDELQPHLPEMPNIFGYVPIPLRGLP